MNNKVVSDKDLIQGEILNAHGVTYTRVAQLLGVSNQAFHHKRKSRKDFLKYVRDKIYSRMVDVEYDRIASKLVKKNRCR